MREPTDAGGVHAVLERLQETARSAEVPWPDVSWRVRAGGRENGSLTLHEGQFRGLRLRQGVELDLEATITSLFPVELAWNGRAAVDGTSERVAPGPSLIQVVPALEAGDEAGLTDLKVAFGAHLDDVEAWYETAVGAVRSPTDGAEVPALRWADIGGDAYGIALLNDCKHGHDALGGRLRLTLIHGSDSPDPLTDLGRHRIRYSLLPHPGGWREAAIPQQGLGFNQPPLVGWGSGGPARPAPTWSTGLAGLGSVLLASAKPAADGSGVVLRLYESAGRAGEVDMRMPPGARAYAVNLVEDPLGELSPDGGRLRLAFSPWEVRSVLLITPRAAVPADREP